MSKVTSKRQVTIPKDVADRYRIEPGDEIEWIPAGDEIRVVPATGRETAGLSAEDRLVLFDRATARRDTRRGEERPTATEPGSGRGWTREELYERGRSD